MFARLVFHVLHAYARWDILCKHWRGSASTQASTRASNCMAIGTGGNMRVNSLRAVIVAWLNALRVGVRLN